MPKPTVRPNGRKVQSRRAELGLTQRGLAEEALCGKRTVENIESSLPVLPETLRQIAGALKVSYEDLLAIEEPDMVRGIEALSSLVEAIRDEIRWMLTNYDYELKMMIAEGRPSVAAKQSLFETSRTRIDKKVKCSQAAKDIKIGLRHRSSEEWDKLFQHTQNLFVSFQNYLHDMCMKDKLCGMGDWRSYQESVLGDIKREINICYKKIDFPKN